MKKALSFTAIIFSLLVLVNCSPKTAKKTAASETKATKTEVATGEKKEIDQSKPLLENIAEKPTTTPLSGASTDEQIAIYKDMAPLRAEIGKKLFTTRCNKCHDYVQPIAKTAASWVHIMVGMGPKAKLNTDEYMEVTAYLVQNAKN